MCKLNIHLKTSINIYNHLSSTLAISTMGAVGMDRGRKRAARGRGPGRVVLVTKRRKEEREGRRTIGDETVGVRCHWGRRKRGRWRSGRREGKGARWGKQRREKGVVVGGGGGEGLLVRCLPYSPDSIAAAHSEKKMMGPASIVVATAAVSTRDKRHEIFWNIPDRLTIYVIS